MEWFVLVDVGCLECGEPSTILGVFETEADGVAAFRERASDWSLPIAGNGVVQEQSATTIIQMAGTGGSYWYQLQLHRYAVAPGTVT